MKAYCLIRPQPWYRREAFCTGLKAAGLELREGAPPKADRDTVVVMWNRYNENHDLANRVEREGGLVIVAENGYLNRGGGTPKFDVHEGVRPEHYYALAVGGHNGSGQWWPQSGERWTRLGIELQPWRNGGEEVLVCPSRGFGRPDLIMSSDWAERVVDVLRQRCKLPIRVRPHPGNSRPGRELEHDLDRAAAVVVWGSSSGVHALIRGIPVICAAPSWICKAAALAVDEWPVAMSQAMPDRHAAFSALAWAQWTVEEIATGAPFAHLLRHARQSQGAAAAR